MDSHLHRAGFLVCTSLCGRLEAVGLPLARGPVFGSQLLHEIFQTYYTMVGWQGFHSKEFTVGNMDLKNKTRERFIQQHAGAQLDGSWKAVHALPACAQVPLDDLKPITKRQNQGWQFKACWMKMDNNIVAQLLSMFLDFDKGLKQKDQIGEKSENIGLTINYNYN